MKLHSKPILLTLTTFVFIGCSSKSMHTVGTTLDNLLPTYALIKNIPVPTTTITNVLKKTEEDKMQKIAEAKKLRKQQEYNQWFSNLSKEEQQKILDKRQRIAAQNRRMIGAILGGMMSGAANSSPSLTHLATLESINHIHVSNGRYNESTTQEPSNFTF